MAENLTIYQRLGKLFGPAGPTAQEPTYQKFKLGSQEILKTDSKKDYEEKKLQMQQSMYLSSQWQKIDNELYTKSIYYEPTRLASYYDYESMEFTPEISAALDIYAEESTTPSEKGYILSIQSESTRIKSILGDLFNNILDVDTNLIMWIRNACKYGDNFVYLKIDPEKGVIGCNQLPNIEIERTEGHSYLNQLDNSDGKAHQVEFKWREKDLTFNSWEIAHFRLLGDDRRLPYGTSMLEKARRIWKQLLLAEDAMLVYRTSRAPERRVFKVFVGNMDDKDVEAYIQKVANKFKRDPVVDPQNGNVDLRMNQMAVDQDYFIPVRDQAAPSPIETLPGATNLSEIADIEYIQKKLLASLRVPKAFLGFEEVVGEGKNLALLDIRFARTINRIQKAIIQELNKIAIIHLYVLGFEDELENFSLGLTNPSTQSELLKLEQWQTKITLYKDAVGDPGSGIAPVSATWAKKFILGMSDEEIKLDLQQQRFEKAVAKELELTPEVIKKTGLFNTIDKLYGEPPTPEGTDTNADDEPGLDMGSEEDSNFDMGDSETEAPGAGDEVTEPVSAAESFNIQNDLPLILEGKGLFKDGLEELFNKTKKNIDSINEEVDSLLED
jgi:hypothetical protein|tara:strand:+ start:9534 stop:11369 length:1836 start_codon:yes stop_codon:yes gene_type:complete